MTGKNYVCEDDRLTGCKRYIAMATLGAAYLASMGASGCGNDVHRREGIPETKPAISETGEGLLNLDNLGQSGVDSARQAVKQFGR